MLTSHDIHFAAGHPTAAGHFPRNPIIPGALLLDEVLRVLAAETGTRAVIVRSAKFFRPVRPGEGLRVMWQGLAGGAINFECRLVESAVLIASGRVEMAVRPA
jgi:3-hydroxymyristoyl/3-hydroxydecanoyl-(acyl carrier protein) dehydratase